MGILLSCRILCASAECAHAHVWDAGDSRSHESPHQVNDDQCICNGGIQSDVSGSVLAGLDPHNLLVPIDIPPPWPGLILPLCESPPEFVGHDSDLAPRGSPSQLRALTQRYRF
jgi:hypothetical protein